MKKISNAAYRILTVVLAIAMTITSMNIAMFATMDQVWADAGAVTQIKNADDFAAMSATGNYKLTSDIEVTKPYSSEFRGTFDGDGHTVTLKLNVTGGNTGLFGKTGSGAVIKNVNVNADVTSSVASSSYGTAGLIGQVSGKTAVSGCGVIGSVTNTSTGTTAAYVGGLIGYIAANCTIDDSYTACQVTNSSKASSAATGGLLGKTSNYYTLGVNNCYASGNVTAEKGYAGGFTGYVYCSTSYKHNYSNCYAAGETKVTGASANAFGFAYSYASSGFNFTNCFYNNGNAKGFNRTSDGITGKTAEELKGLADTLGEAYQADTVNLNKGFPILSWQYIDPEATCRVTVKVTPADSVLTWDGKAQEVNESGIYTFDNVKTGSYSYSVANEAGDYAQHDGVIAAKGKDIEENVDLQLNTHNLTFTLNPKDANLEVKSGNTVLKPVSGNTYAVTNGTYNYEASAFGYKTQKSSVDVNRGDKTGEINLQANPIVTATFAYDEHKDEVAKGKLVVTVGDREMSPKADSKGMVYDLPAGYLYEYKFTSGNYARQTGTIDLTDVTEAREELVTVTMKEKTAWEGAEDISEPEKTDGIYQISSGSELAWLAQQINSGKNNTCNAVLSKDIDLGGTDNWTPIGKTGSASFKGNFDGKGHIVKNMKIEGSTSGNYALFGYVDSGKINNLTVSGTVNITGSGSSSYGVAGIVGNLYGTAGSVENCVNKVNVSGSQNVGGVVGMVSGGYGTATKAITNCANLGNIKSVSNNAGGIAGYIYGQVTVDSCYNRGDCTSGSYRAGGITAYMSSSYARIRNCYSTGNTKVTYGSDARAIVGNKSSGTVEKESCFYLGTLQADVNGTSVTEEELKTKGAELGENFVTAPEGENDGYPILKFQIKTYKVSFVVNDENAAVSIDGQKGVHSGNTWTFDLPEGTYEYNITSYGKVSQSDTLTVKGTAVEKTITLEDAARKTVTFNISPENTNAVISIMLDGNVVESGKETAYNLPYGTYTYAVKAKGYAKGTGELTVDKDSEDTVKVVLTESTAWDGATLTKPSGEGTEANPYQIEDGEQLAWFADAVNSGTTVKAIYAELTDNVKLGNNPWTPIGKDFHEFKGVFDGNGYTVSGLNVSDVNDAGLFGVINGAEIKNITVKGSVKGKTDTAYGAGGIAGRAKTSQCTFTNCGNEADVTGGNAAGIIGSIHTYGINCTISGCYNTGNIEGSERAGGIVGRNNGSATTLKVKSCYNTGDIQSSQYAGGILGGAGITVSDSYVMGTVKGNGDTNTGALSTGKSDSVTGCYYLEGTAKDKNQGSEEISAMKLHKLDINDSFCHVNGINRNYPVLKWQNLVEKTGTAVLAENTEFKLAKVYMPSTAETDNPETHMLTTPELSWSAIDGAEKYAVTIWRNEIAGDGEESPLEAKFVTAVYDVTKTEYDCTEIFKTLPEGVYYAAVVAMDKENNCVMPSKAMVEDDVVGWQVPYDRLKKVENLRWDGTKACWNAKDNFTDDDMYTVILYTVTGDGNKESDYHFFKSFELAGNYSATDFRNMITAETKYAFTVIAHTGENYQVLYGLTDSPESDMSPIFTVGTSEEPGENHEGWEAISSAEDWIKLANVKDELSNPDDTSSPSKQEIAWSKNYYLTDDIDFSKLSAADQVKTKSIGNVNYRFAGTLDGNGHKIKGLTLSNNDAGLFWYVGSTGYIYDLTIENANVLFSDNAAVIAQKNYGKIEKCGVVNCNITADTGAVLGGMVSRNYGVIRESYVQGGSLKSNSQTATGHAGFVGANENGATIERCWTSMNVKTDSDYAGGFVGLGYGGTVRDCFALGDVLARSYSGGFIGRSVYDGNTYENCYAAGKLTVSDKEGHGFIGGNKPDSSFQYDQSHGVVNCYYNSASPADSNGAVAKSLDEMKENAFLNALNKNASWSQDGEHNDGLPYLTYVKVPEQLKTVEITVDIALATYDKDNYEFVKKDDVISITMKSNGNTRLVDLMDEAVAQGKLTYEYETTPTYGRFIETINNYSISAPDGWMFTINDKLSNVGASLATVGDGDRVLWFEGTTENHFKGPDWNSLDGEMTQWVDIADAEALKQIAASTDKETLSKNYRLTADIDLKGESFKGIGSVDAPFAGLFDGQNHKVSNFVIDGTNNAEGTGFFNVIKDATIKNLKLVNADVTGKNKVGALVGWAQVQLDKNDISKNVANLVGNCSATGKVTGDERVGGLVGSNDGKYDDETLFSIGSTVNKSAFSGSVKGNYKIGGLIGENAGYVTKGESAGTVESVNAEKPAATAGGLVGDNSGSIYSSKTSSAVSGGNIAGGFVGYSDGTVKDAYSTGSVCGSNYVGSFAGSISSAENVIGAGTVKLTGNSAQSYVGGFSGNMGGTIVGTASMITIKNAYGNCVGEDGTILTTVGNMNAFTSDSQKEVLDKMALKTTDDVCSKFHELTGETLDIFDSEEVKALVAAIDQLPEEITLADKETVKEARAAYEELSAEDKAKIRNYSKLVMAERDIRILESEAELEQIKKQLDKVNSDIADLQKKYDALEAESEATKAQLAEANSKLTQLQEKYDSLKADSDTTKTQLETVKNELDSAKNDVETAKAQLTELNNKIEAQKTAIEEGNALLNTVKAELAEAENGSEANQAELAKAEKQIKEASAKIEAAKAESEKAKMELQVVKSQLDLTVAELELAKKDIENVNSEMVKAKTQVEELKAELAAVKAELAKAKAKSKKVTGLKLSSKSRKITASWKATKGATGYQVMYKAKNAKSYKTLAGTKSLKAVTQKLKKGTTYKFKVRTYTEVAGHKVYGKWTSVKYVKCK